MVTDAFWDLVVMFHGGRSARRTVLDSFNHEYHHPTLYDSERVLR